MGLSLHVLKHRLSFFCPSSTFRIFDFSLETVERNFTELGTKCRPLPNMCVSGPFNKNDRLGL